MVEQVSLSKVAEKWSVGDAGRITNIPHRQVFEKPYGTSSRSVVVSILFLIRFDFMR